MDPPGTSLNNIVNVAFVVLQNQHNVLRRSEVCEKLGWTKPSLIKCYILIGQSVSVCIELEIRMSLNFCKVGGLDCKHV